MSLNTIAAGASPLALFRDYLQRGELAYQFDAASGQQCGQVGGADPAGEVHGVGELQTRGQVLQRAADHAFAHYGEARKGI